MILLAVGGFFAWIIYGATSIACAFLPQSLLGDFGELCPTQYTQVQTSSYRAAQAVVDRRNAIVNDNKYRHVADMSRFNLDPGEVEMHILAIAWAEKGQPPQIDHKDFEYHLLENLREISKLTPVINAIGKEFENLAAMVAWEEAQVVGEGEDAREVVIDMEFEHPSIWNITSAYLDSKNKNDEFKAKVAEHLALQQELYSWIHYVSDERMGGFQGILADVGPLGRSYDMGMPNSHPDVEPIGITSSYGMRLHPIRGEFIMHRGIDLAMSGNTPVHAVTDGVVLVAGSVAQRIHGAGPGHGPQVVVIQSDAGLKSLYAHLGRVVVKAGDRVKRGDLIGNIATSAQLQRYTVNGRPVATGPHLHLEIMLRGPHQDPCDFYVCEF